MDSQVDLEETFFPLLYYQDLSLKRLVGSGCLIYADLQSTTRISFHQFPSTVLVMKLSAIDDIVRPFLNSMKIYITLTRKVPRFAVSFSSFVTISISFQSNFSVEFADQCQSFLMVVRTRCYRLGQALFHSKIYKNSKGGISRVNNYFFTLNTDKIHRM